MVERQRGILELFRVPPEEVTHVAGAGLPAPGFAATPWGNTPARVTLLTARGQLWCLHINLKRTAEWAGPGQEGANIYRRRNAEQVDDTLRGWMSAVPWLFDPQ